ncbi:CHASE2 domain-containing protein [Stenotrophomonas sp. Iso1]|uniref:CHASE2 domain-containing protein n=1 Tax=Stenotrophomonas sp. Iso1 TaxID=2977283 RepID=UPI0022B776FE|nr:CHASE2 domain-containing protein [Stenotrophomonas sp. Iso1]
MRTLRLRWHQQLLLVALMGALAGWISHTNVFWQQDEVAYDHLVSNWNYEADPSLLIVAIDDHSLQQLGQWPWPRSTHARLLDRLQQAGAERIALDLLFIEPDRKDREQDTLLADAIKRSGNVLLPVLAVAPSDEAVPEELMPVPVIASAAALLAHTDIEIEGDGVARGLYLKAGIGSAYWPALGMALAGHVDPVPGLPSPQDMALSPYQWHRDHYVRLRYAGPPGTFPQVSYSDVLEGRIAPGLLHGRRVIVGMTASGVAPRLLTPTSHERWMSGSEYQANVASMLLAHHAILPLMPPAQIFFVALLVMLCALATNSSLPPWLVAVVAIPAPVLLSFILLRAFNLWFAPVAAVACSIALLLAWGLWRIRYWRHQANRDPLTGLANRMRFEETLQLETDAARRSGRPLSLLLVDVDYFKSYNDTYGHYVGDRVLRQVADTIDDLARRPRDLAARFGGDEFAVILPDTPQAGAVQLIETLLARTRQQGITVDKGQLAQVSLTIGVYTVVPTAQNTPAHLFEAADAALYRAKEAGRDTYSADPPIA